jgi:F-type H+-transporting ATPase subunit delta
MHGVSRESLSSVDQTLDEQLRDVDGAGALQVGDELYAVLSVLDDEPVLRRMLADASTPEASRVGLLESLFGDRVGEGTLEVLRGAVRAHWSQPADLVDAIEILARQATFTGADRDGALDEVEDELFRFGRILDAEPELQTALGDRSASAERRQELLDTLVADRVRPATRRLLDRAVGAPRGRSLERTIEDLCDQAAARRDRSVARVRSAVPLSDDEQERLIAALARIYRRDVVLQIDVDPSVLGGLLVRVGDDVIDGTVLHRIDEVRRDLTG